MVKKYTSMAYANADDMLFGQSKFPVKAGLGLEIGAGYTTPEVELCPKTCSRRIQGKTRKRIRKDHHRHYGKNGPDRCPFHSA